MKINLTKPYWGLEELEVAEAAMRQTNGAGDSLWGKKLERLLTEISDTPYVYPVTSCSHGLELVARSLGIKAGDEVILPSFTMSSTANCVIQRGAVPVFADIESTYYMIDPEDTAKLITPKTKAIILVHYAGMPAQIEKFRKLAKENHLLLIEDAAHAIGSLYKNRMPGTFGDAGVYSFHGTKNISCGEGGAVVTGNKNLAEKMEIYRANGTNRNKFLKGLVDKYSWVSEGSSYFLSDILAAIAYVQLKKMREINRWRAQIAKYYHKVLTPYSAKISLPQVPTETQPNWHIYAIRFKRVSDAGLFVDEMREKDIDAAWHYVPLHSSQMGRRISRYRKLPVTDEISRALVRLPIYAGLSERQMEYVADTSAKILKKL